jgi:hypothetical protein
MLTPELAWTKQDECSKYSTLLKCHGLEDGEPIRKGVMTVRKIAKGQMWKDEKTGEIFVVTSLYKDVLSSFALLRSAQPVAGAQSKRAKIIRQDSGEVLAGYREAEQV